MDGLSAAASGFAVVSLAIQLVGSVSKIKQFMQSVTEAPKELGKLVELLEQLELILQQIVMLAQKQQNSRLGETEVLTCMMRAIKTCEAKLSMLENVIKVTKQSCSATSRAVRTIGSVKLACKKKEIQEFESQVHDAINLLTLTMMENLTYAHSESMEQLLSKVTATNQATSTITEELAHIRIGLANDQRDDRNNTPEVAQYYSQGRDRSRKPRNLSTPSTTSRRYTSIFGNLYVRKISRSANFKNGVIQRHTVDESNWVFMPSFISSCFNFRYLSTCGSIQRSIRTYPVIPDSHEIWDMCTYGDLKGVQRLLSERQVSPFSVDSDGQTLLHCATEGYSYTICELLFQTGLSGEEINSYGHTPCHFARYVYWLPDSDWDFHNFSKTYYLFSSRIDGLGPVMFDYTLSPFFSLFNPDALEFIAIMNEFIHENSVSRRGYNMVCLAIKTLWQSAPTYPNYDSWKQATQHLINLLGDSYNHKRAGQKHTLLDRIMDIALCPFDSLSIGRIFLDLLSHSKLDVAAYLRAEFEFHFDPSKSLPMLPRKECIGGSPDRCLIISITPLSVSWDWYINPKGNAFAVLSEFKYLDSEYESLGMMMYSGLFSESRWTKLSSIDRGYLSPEDLSALNILEDRFERRRQKKAVKLFKAQGTYSRSLKIPGAWIY